MIDPEVIQIIYDIHKLRRKTRIKIRAREVDAAFTQRAARLHLIFKIGEDAMGRPKGWGFTPLAMAFFKGLDEISNLKTQAFAMQNLISNLQKNNSLYTKLSESVVDLGADELLRMAKETYGATLPVKVRRVLVQMASLGQKQMQERDKKNEQQHNLATK